MAPSVESAFLTVSAPLFVIDELSSDNRIAKAVRGQRITVSANTSQIPKRPTVAGDVEVFLECAIPDVPAPASFERSPRENPSDKAFENRKADTPPVAARKLNADLKMLTIRRGIPLALIIMTESAITIYRMEARGIAYLHALVILSVPPRMAIKTNIINIAEKI